MELLAIAVIAAFAFLLLGSFPISAHGGFFPFEGVESSDRADRVSGRLGYRRPGTHGHRHGHEGVDADHGW